MTNETVNINLFIKELCIKGNCKLFKILRELKLILKYDKDGISLTFTAIFSSTNILYPSKYKLLFIDTE